MPFNAEKFCIDNAIRYDKSSYDWIQIKCPFCDDKKKHLGLNINRAYTNCFRCGGHWLPKVVATILKISIAQAKIILIPYLSREQIQEFKKKNYAESVIYPPDTGAMNKKQREYLEKRRFDPDKLEIDWGVLGVGKLGKYKGRILTPIYLHNQLISYQTRDITGKSHARYMACSEEDEAYCH